VQKETLPFHTGSSSGIYLITLQKFLSTYVFHNSQLNDILLKDKHYILKDVKFISCPRQTNSFDCCLFGLGTMLHAMLRQMENVLNAWLLYVHL
jgi:Ulp1 family protease